MAILRGRAPASICRSAPRAPMDDSSEYPSRPPTRGRADPPNATRSLAAGDQSELSAQPSSFPTEHLIRLGTRGSRLARIQTALVASRLRDRHPRLALEERVITTKPDRHPDVPIAQLGDKALFVLEIEEALY